MSKYPLFYAYLDTNIPDILYRRMISELEIDNWVDDFDKLLGEFEKVHDNDDGNIQFVFEFYDRTGQLNIQAYAKDDSIQVSHEDGESYADWIIEELNKFLAEKDICKVPDCYNVMYYDKEFYIPYRWAGYSGKYDTLYVRDTISTASDYEWEDWDEY